MQRSIEILIGKLITDEDFRRSFTRDPHGTLSRAAAWGLDVSAGEMLALMATDPALWEMKIVKWEEKSQAEPLWAG